MPFEQTRFTNNTHDASAGTWRWWLYKPSPDNAEDDLTKPGYFGAMEGHIHAGDLVVVSTAKVTKLMAFGIGDDGIVAVPMCEAKMPQSNMQPMPQVLPGGTQPNTGAEYEADDTKHEAVSAPAAEHMEHNAPLPAAEQSQASE